MSASDTSRSAHDALRVQLADAAQRPLHDAVVGVVLRTVFVFPGRKTKENDRGNAVRADGIDFAVEHLIH